MENDYVIHFNVKIKNKNLKINRNNYAIIDKKVHNKPPKFIIDSYIKEPEERLEIYEDKNCTIYSDKWCINHQEDCLKNYDYNMNFFEKLDKNKFDKNLDKVINFSKNIKEIYDLNELKDSTGVYILVLDEYKQIYIGQSSSSIKKRIMSHWSKKKEFDKLIFGNIEDSIISIDSFGALDTTRIFVYPTYDVYMIEEKLVNLMDSKYLLNRTAGGIGSAHNYTNSKTTALIAIAANIKKRNFKE